MIQKANMSLRRFIQAAGVRHWQLADALGISEKTLCLWLRHELNDEKTQMITDTVDRMLAEEESTGISAAERNKTAGDGSGGV